MRPLLNKIKMKPFKRLRRGFLESNLESLCKENPDMKSWANELMMKPGWTPDGCPNEEIADYVDFKFENNAMGYVREIVSQIVNFYGVDSKEFKELTKGLLTKQERKLVIENVKKSGDPKDGHYANFGISKVKDRDYKIKEKINLFNKARKVSEKLPLNISKLPADTYVKHLREWVESNPLYLHYSN